MVTRNQNHSLFKNDDVLYLPYGIWKETYSPADYEELVAPQNFEKCVVLNENNIFAYLESLDYDSSKLVTKI